MERATGDNNSFVAAQGHHNEADDLHDTQEGESWVEVTNKANQTPNHWVYNDMILEDNLIVSNNDLIYPFATSQSTFNSYLGADTSQHNSPRFIQRTSSPYQHIYSNHEATMGSVNKTQPAPPPYPPHLSTVMPLRTRSPLVQPRLLHSTAPPTMAPPPAPSSPYQSNQALPSSTPSSSNKRRRRNISNSEGQKK